MKLFWGLIETVEKHMHTFNPDKWVKVANYTITTDLYARHKSTKKALEYQQNTCLTCGDLIEYEFIRADITE